MTDGWFLFVLFVVIGASVGAGEYLKWRVRR